MIDTELLPYLRQYRHNDGSDGLVFGYEKEGIDRLVAMLRAQLAAPVAAQSTVEDIARFVSEEWQQPDIARGIRLQFAAQPAPAQGEPTEAMIEAGARYGVDGDFDNDLSNGMKDRSRKMAVGVYRAMIAAAKER